MLRLQIFGTFCASDSLGRVILVKSKKARALLAFLALPPGKPRSREEIMALLWSERGEEQARSSLRQVLSALRKELGEETVAALQITDESVALNADCVTVNPAVAGEILLQGVHINDPAFDEWLRGERARFEDREDEGKAKRDLPLPDRPSIVVLPFLNLSDDAGQEYFCDGITEDIITDLARFDSLFVIARTSSFHYKGRTPRSQDVGRELGVEYVVEGSVRRAGKRIRVTAQLVEAASGAEVWAERYDRDLEDIFEVQDEVVREIVTAIPGQLDVAAFRRIHRRPVENLTAYEYLLRALHLRHQDWGSKEAVPLMEKAIAADPHCASAYADLANWHAYSALAHGAQLEEARALTLPYAEKAVRLDPNNSSLLGVVAEAYLMSGDLELARQNIEKAVQLNANNYNVMTFAGAIFAYLGDIEEALRWNERILRYDPISIDAVRENSLEVYYMAERFEDAIASFAGWQNPPWHVLAEAAAAYAQAGRLQEAAELREAFEASLPPGHSFARHFAAQMTMCARQEDHDLWAEGYRKAGFKL